MAGRNPVFSSEPARVVPETPWHSPSFGGNSMMTFLRLLLLALLPAVVCAQPTANVVLILVDDLGTYDLGCYGATEVRTPRIDRLAAEGVQFLDYYAAAPICSPQRSRL